MQEHKLLDAILDIRFKRMIHAEHILGANHPDELYELIKKL